MKRAFFAPTFQAMSASFALGDEAVEAAPVTITRELADALLQAVSALGAAEGDPELFTREACWRDLRARRWPEVLALHNRMEMFLASQDDQLSISSAEWTLLEEAIECVEAIGALASAGVEFTWNRALAVLGVAGGVATLVALF